MAAATRPFVRLLSLSTEATLRLIGVRAGKGRAVTEEEINAILEEGSESGAIEAHEHQIVRNVFRLDDRTVSSMMIPRDEIDWLDAKACAPDIVALVERSPHSRYPVCRGGLDDVVGIIAVRELFRQLAQGRPLEPARDAQAAVFVPETLTGLELLTNFRDTGVHMALVVDEYGEIQGMVTVSDVVEAIAGEFNPGEGDEAWAVRRPNGSWLLDGLIPTHELKDCLALRDLPDEDRDRYNTLAGMIVLLLGHLPQTADAVDWGGWRFEVVDMDGRRIDKILVAPLEPASPD